MKTNEQTSKDFADEFFEFSDKGLTMQPMIRLEGGSPVETYRDGDFVLAGHGEGRVRIVGHWGYWNTGIVETIPWPEGAA